MEKVTISYIGMVLYGVRRTAAVSSCYNLLYRYGTNIFRGCFVVRKRVTISYIGMVQQHFVVIYIITTKYHNVNKKTRRHDIFISQSVYLQALFYSFVPE